MSSITHTVIVNGGFSSFLETFINFRGWLHALPVLNQILVFIGLIALTVGIAVVLYYIIQGAFKLTFEVLKAIVHMIKGLLDAFYRHATAPRHPRNPQHHRNSLPASSPYLRKPARRINSHHLPKVPPTVSAAPKNNSSLHCPECGEIFTPEMIQVMSKQHQVFCEFCGKNLEYIMS